MFAHVFEKYVHFVEEGNHLGPQLPNVFPDFRNRRILRTRMQNVDDVVAKSPQVFENTTDLLSGCAYFAHVFEKGAKFAAGRVRAQNHGKHNTNRTK